MATAAPRPAGVRVDWGGWVGLGRLTGFGPIHPLPGIWDDLTIDSAITLPIGLETYAAYALAVWLSNTVADLGARLFAKVSAITSLVNAADIGANALAMFGSRS